MTVTKPPRFCQISNRETISRSHCQLLVSESDGRYRIRTLPFGPRRKTTTPLSSASGALANRVAANLTLTATLVRSATSDRSSNAIRIRPLICVMISSNARAASWQAQTESPAPGPKAMPASFRDTRMPRYSPFDQLCGHVRILFYFCSPSTEYHVLTSANSSPDIHDSRAFVTLRQSETRTSPSNAKTVRCRQLEQQGFMSWPPNHKIFGRHGPLARVQVRRIGAPPCDKPRAPRARRTDPKISLDNRGHSVRRPWRSRKVSRRVPTTAAERNLSTRRNNMSEILLSADSAKARPFRDLAAFATTRSAGAKVAGQLPCLRGFNTAFFARGSGTSAGHRGPKQMSLGALKSSTKSSSMTSPFAFERRAGQPDAPKMPPF